MKRFKISLFFITLTIAPFGLSAKIGLATMAARLERVDDSRLIFSTLKSSKRWSLSRGEITEQSKSLRTKNLSKLVGKVITIRIFPSQYLSMQNQIKQGAVTGGAGSL